MDNLTFSFNGNAITVILKNNEPWFIGAEVCHVLGITNSGNIFARLKEYEKGIHTMDTLGGEQQKVIISESGLYRLVLKSRKPQAEAFQDWVCQEVLPSIRKTGSYSVKAMTPTEALLQTVQALVELERRQDKLQEEQIRLAVEQQVTKALAEQAKTQADSTEAKVTVLEAEMVALKAAITQPIPTCKQTARQRIVELAQLMANYLVKSGAFKAIPDAIREVWNRINLKVRNSSLRIDLASRRANNKRQYEADLKAWEIAGKPKGSRPVKNTYALTIPEIVEGLGIETDTLKCTIAVASELVG